MPIPSYVLTEALTDLWTTLLNTCFKCYVFPTFLFPLEKHRLVPSSNSTNTIAKVETRNRFNQNTTSFTSLHTSYTIPSTKLSPPQIRSVHYAHVWFLTTDNQTMSFILDTLLLTPDSTLSIWFYLRLSALHLAIAIITEIQTRSAS